MVDIVTAGIDTRRLAALEDVIERGVQTFIEVGNALREIRDSRLYRAEYVTFDDYCRERWGMQRAHAYRQIEAAGVASALSPIGDTPLNEAQARELAPLLKKDEQEALAVWRELREAPGGEHVTAERVRRLVKKRVERIVREEGRAQSCPTSLPREAFSGLATIHHCDFRELDIPEKSVDLIFTDPPYPGEYLPLWADLGRFAAKALKPGGLLVSYSGQYHLNQIMDSLSTHLEYYWLGGIVSAGQRNQVFARRVHSRVKPLLFYKPPKGGGARDWFLDAYLEGTREKGHHEWQQSVDEARYYIERLTAPGDLVVDPFLGGGPTAVAAQELGRRFIGCDVDAQAVSVTHTRLWEQVA